MYKALFQNSKVALIFALVTILSAVSMVGTSEDGGLLTRMVTLVGNSRSQAGGDAYAPGTAPPAAPSVFGEYKAKPAQASAAAPARVTDIVPAGGPVTGEGQSAPPPGEYNPMTAPRAPGGIQPSTGAGAPQ